MGYVNTTKHIDRQTIYMAMEEELSNPICTKSKTMGVFSTEEKAKNYVKRYIHNNCLTKIDDAYGGIYTSEYLPFETRYYIESHEVDVEDGEVTLIGYIPI
jgi:hypothetical protein